MGPFEFIILFFSFIYTLALTHLLLAAARMIRHRRSLVFSWPHALWMLDALLLLVCNWISLWDFHQLKSMTLPVILGGFALVGILYVVCALIAPDFEDGDGLDLRAFHEREGRTYILAFCDVLAAGLRFEYRGQRRRRHSELGRAERHRLCYGAPDSRRTAVPRQVGADRRTARACRCDGGLSSHLLPRHSLKPRVAAIHVFSRSRVKG